MWRYSDESVWLVPGLATAGMRSLLKKPELGMPSAAESPMPGSPVPAFRNPESLPAELNKPEGGVVRRSGVVAFCPLAALTILGLGVPASKAPVLTAAEFGGLVKAGFAGAGSNTSEFAKLGLKPPALPLAELRMLELMAAFNPPVT